MYIVEGNIGAGKSTFLSMIAQYAPHISVALEPLHNWQRQVHGQSLLSQFISNPRRWAYTMETLTMMCRVKEHLQEQSMPIEKRLVERSIYSGHYCFALNGYESGYMSDVEWGMYSQWFHFLIPGKCRPPQGFIYLRVDPEVAYQRIMKRNRPGEKGIPLEYLRAISTKHDDFLLYKRSVLSELEPIPVLTVDVNQEFEENLNYFNELLFQVEEFIYKTQRIAKESQVTVPEKHIR